jgi:hypothetical protein
LATDFEIEAPLFAWERTGVTKAENQRARAHVTEAMFALTLDTPVRRWVEGTGLGLALGLDEAARMVSAGRAMSATKSTAVQRKQCSQTVNQQHDDHDQGYCLCTYAVLWFMLHDCAGNASSRSIRGYRMIGCGGLCLFVVRSPLANQLMSPLFMPENRDFSTIYW